MKEEKPFFPDDIYRFLDLTLSVRSNSQEVLDYLRAVYARFFFGCDGSVSLPHQEENRSSVLEVIDRTKEDRELHVRDDSDSYTLQCESVYSLDPADPQWVDGIPYPLAYVQWYLLRHVSLRVEDYHFIHAGALAWKERALIFPAPSGGGKTTLCLGLLSKGFRFLSDEIACLHRNSGIVEPFPRTARFDERTRGLLGIPASQVAKAPHARGENAGWLLHVENVFPSVSGGAPILRYMIFLRGQGETTRLEPLSQTGALFALFKQSFRKPENIGATLFEFAPLMKEVRCFNLVLGDLTEAVDMVRALVDHTGEADEGCE